MSLDNTLPPCEQVSLALQLCQTDPKLGGVILRARSGPVRDAILASLPKDAVRLHPEMGDEVLNGGVDLTASLAAGTIVHAGGILDRANTWILSMAERSTPEFCARLCHAQAQRKDVVLVVLDEGAREDETVPPQLSECLAFAVDVTDVPYREFSKPELRRGETASAVCTPGQQALLVELAVAFGISSMRAPLLALNAARALASRNMRAHVTNDDISTATALVYGPRATRLPQPPQPEEPQQPAQSEPDTAPGENLTEIPQDLVLDAVLAQLPDGLLAKLANSASRGATGSGAGAKKRGNHRGRPLAPRPGRKRDGTVIDVVSTLRSAAPWQRLRGRQSPDSRVEVRASDLRIKQFESRSDRLLIFAVDASGSAAIARLAEAKGAVELLLSEAYARRDHVSLLAFRGQEAELLLPPTRSLVQTKRRLAQLPGGGGTPLATGLELALQQALLAKRRGMTPTVCLLTDGRANIARDGSANRKLAMQEAETVGAHLRANGIASIVIDTSNRPDRKLCALADQMGADYLPMPRADAHRMSKAVMTHVGT